MQSDFGDKPYPVQPNAPSTGHVPPPPPAPPAAAPQPTTDDYKTFDIVRATQYGVHERCVELIEGGYDVNQPDQENVSLLHWAAINNRIDIVKLVPVTCCDDFTKHRYVVNISKLNFNSTLKKCVKTFVGTTSRKGQW